MGDWNLGSVATEVLVLVENVPTSISGEPTERIADRKRQFAENFTGQTIGSNSIGIQFQGPILNLTICEVLQSMNLIGADASEVRLGEFHIKKTGNQGSNNLQATCEQLKEAALADLQTIGTTIRFHKALG